MQKPYKLNNRRLRSFLLNFGPQHPAAHGILKIGLVLVGDLVVRADPQFGLLHRGSEKLTETRTLYSSLPYLDRMDYVANIIQEQSFVSAVESSFSLIPNYNINVLRIIFNEFSRILNHLLTVSAICLDMGSMGPIFWAFEEREQIMEYFERLSGARMHTALLKPFGLTSNINTNSLFLDAVFLINRGSRFINGSFLGLLNNRALKTRLSGVGFFSKAKINKYGVTGIIARSAGQKIDLRLNSSSVSTLSYNFLSFKSFLGKKSDCYDRFVIRSKEIIESFKIINQCLSLNVSLYSLKKSKNISMESTIESFKNNSSFASTTTGVFTGSVESPKGCVTSIIALNGLFSAYRFYLRSPVAHNMNLISTIGNLTTFADFVATFCSIDVVLGEIDR